MSNEFETDDNLDEIASSLVDGEATGVPDSRLNELMQSHRFRESIDDFSRLSDQLKSPVPVDNERRSAQIGAALAAFDMIDGSTDTEQRHTGEPQWTAPVTDLVQHRHTRAARRDGGRSWSPLLSGVAALFLVVVGFGLVRLSSNGASDSLDAAADFAGDGSDTAAESAVVDESSDDSAEPDGSEAGEVTEEADEATEDRDSMEDDGSDTAAAPKGESAGAIESNQAAADTDAEESARNQVVEGRVVVDLIEPGSVLEDLAIEYSQDTADSGCATPTTEAGVAAGVLLLLVDDEPIDLFVVEDSTGPISGIALHSQTCEVIEEFPFP